MTDEQDVARLGRILATHREPSQAQDAVAILRSRTPPRHRARRRLSRPPVVELEAVQPQHAYDGNTLLR